MVVGRKEDSLREFTKASGGDAYVVKAKTFSAVHREIGRLLAKSLCGSPNCESGTASRPMQGVDQCRRAVAMLGGTRRPHFEIGDLRHL